LAAKFTKAACALLWSAIVFYLCLTDVKALPSVAMDGFDKLSHFIFHFVFSALWYSTFAAWKPENSIKNRCVTVALFSFFYGVLIEFLQHFCTDGRQADWKDVLGNSMGAIAFLTLLFLFLKIKKKKQVLS
jgi:VanZ family protein